jgi:hypothetical protein
MLTVSFLLNVYLLEEKRSWSIEGDVGGGEWSKPSYTVVGSFTKSTPGFLGKF